MKQIVEISGRRFEVELPPAGHLGSAVIDGLSITFDLYSATPGCPASLLVEGRSYALESDFDGNLWRFSINGDEFAARVSDERREALSLLTGATGDRAFGAGELRAPMPGLVVKLLVAAGDRIAQGQGVIVVEAMKMENEIGAPLDGVVGQCHIQPGQAVEKGQILITMRPE